MQKTILIVEDHFDSRNVLNFLLKDYGYKIVEAHNGEEAIKAVREEMPALILMDLALPDMDGVTVTKIIREMGETEKLPIFAVTAHWSFYYRRAEDIGFTGVIDKPVDHANLLRVIDQYI